MKPDLASAIWLRSPAIQSVFDAVDCGGDETRVVGGAVRNALLAFPVADIDMATTALPHTVVKRCKSAGLKVVPTGLDHGTVTVFSQGKRFELTTLRQDVETFGRRAHVKFGRSWTEDARRRDFTLNALYCDRRGAVFDPLGGLEDCLARRVKFIGDPRQRIREDYLRILRLFRIHATYSEGPVDPEGLAACREEREGLHCLSGERIRMEMSRLLLAPAGPDCIQLMQQQGILQCVLGEDVRIDRFLWLSSYLNPADEDADALLALAALVGLSDAAIHQISDHFRLSNAERERMVGALAAERHVAGLNGRFDAEDICRLLYRHGRQGSVDGVRLAFADKRTTKDDPAFKKLLGDLKERPVPVFPVKGGDLIAAGASPGPALGQALARLEAQWLESGCQLDRATLCASHSK